jgi:hypothetical protein
MDHEEYKQSLLVDPGRPTPAMLAHLADCRDCEAYTDRLMRFEGRVERALRFDAPGPAGSGLRSASRPRMRFWRRGLAVAASVFVAVVVAGGLWLFSTGRTLAADVVDHMAGEPGAWTRTEMAVSAPRLDQVMAGSNLHLKPGTALVSYANSCAFRGHQVPHLVLRTAAGPVTVMVLTHESLHGAVHFDEQGYRGMILPVPGHGSLAVLEHGSRSDSATLQQVAAGVLAGIVWTR